MPATLKARFDGKCFFPEEKVSLEAGRTYVLRIEETDSTISSKIDSLRTALQDEIFLRDLRAVADDFSAVDAED